MIQNKMTPGFKKQRFVHGFFILACVCLCDGCATLPEVSKVIDETPSNETLQIASAKRLLSPKQSEDIIRRLKAEAGLTDVLKRQIDVLESASGVTLKSGNRVTLLIDGPATYSAMFEAIKSAKNNINLETFIFSDDDEGKRLADLLLEKQASGVQVNMIYDSVGSLHTSPSFFERMRKGGIHVVEYNPVNLLRVSRTIHRDHRKVLIIDGSLVITGGVNISGVYVSSELSGRERNQLEWRDTDIKIEGPAVANYQAIFLETWKQQKGPELPHSGYFPPLKNEGKDLVLVIANTPGKENRLTFISYVSAIIFANNSVHLTNAYFVPDEQTISALKGAAKRGVDVKIILPRISTSSLALYAGHYYYSDLLESGVKLYERQNATLHAKTGVIDGVWSTVGSSNMDFWSFLMNDEINAVILSTEFASEMEKMFDKDISNSDQVKLEKWKQRPLYPRIRELIAHMFRHWL
ncbi:MAG TPA: cardiolipin synthase [Dissulfurispiraceae bacterium]|nr:cardiolipin synthase [Dissulfurispiraceae bacterium]